MFEHYREGLGQRLHQVAEEVLKADGPEHEGQTEGPSIVPSDEIDEVTEEINQFLARKNK